MESQSKLYPLWRFTSRSDVSTCGRTATEKEEIKADQLDQKFENDFVPMSQSEFSQPSAGSYFDKSDSIASFKEFDDVDLIGVESEISVLSDGGFLPMFCSTPIFPDSNSDMFSREILPDQIPTFSESYGEFCEHPTNTSTPMNVQTPCTPSYR